MQESRYMEINGMRLKKLREDRALSLRALADKSGVTPGTINDLERSKRGAYPSTVRKLSEALGVEPRELRGDRG